MPALNKANRQVCDVDIRILKTMQPFLFFDTANTTTAGLTGDAVYAMKKGTRAIAFQNPIEASMTIEAQIVPFKFYSLLSDGIVETDAAYAKKETIKATTGGSLAVANAKAGSVFVFKSGEYGDEPIEGTYANGTFTATTAGDTSLPIPIMKSATSLSKILVSRKYPSTIRRFRRTTSLLCPLLTRTRLAS